MEIKKYTLTKVYRSDKDKNGVALMSKAGKPYTKLALKVQEIGNGETWVSGFGNKSNEGWKEGDVVEIIVTKNGDYYNFETPKAEDKLASRVSALEVQVMNLTNQISKLTPKSNPASSNEPTAEDLKAFNDEIPNEVEPDF